MQIYINMAMQIVIQYNIALMYEMVMIRYCNIIIIMFLTGYHIF